MSDKEILEIEDFLEEGFNIIEEEIKDSMDKETEKNQKIFPLLAVRNIVLFPKVIMPITAGREKSIKLLQEAHK
ncbi:LON peptidase substrate-binding domain-containing protein, partial [Elizabethkingia meningoseptica]